MVNTNIYKKNMLIQNMRGWPVSHSRIMRTIEEIAKKVNAQSAICVLALSEMVPGKNRFYIKKLLSLLEQEWELAEPYGYDIDIHWRSAVNIIMVKKGFAKQIESLEIPNMNQNSSMDFSGLYCYVKLELPGKTEPLFIMNNHHIQLQNEGKPIAYQLERSMKASVFWEATLAELQRKKNENLLFVGDHNAERGYGVNSDKIALVEQILPDTFCGDRNNAVTYTDPAGNGHRFDHVFSNVGGVSWINVHPTVNGYSDHNSLLYSFN